VSLSFSSTSPAVVLIDHEIVDVGGLANGRPDPGETVDLIATLRNFGAFADDVQVQLETTDPYLVIVDGSSDLGDLDEGEVAATSADPFTFEVSAQAPSGHIAELRVRAAFTGGETVTELLLCIGRFNYLVWDPTDDRSSGPVIAAILAGSHFSGSYTESLPLSRLDDYASLWVSCGIFPTNYLVDSAGLEGQAIVDFMAGGGSVYLEGGDVWYYDPQIGGFDFRSHFGISATIDGSGDLSRVQGVTGQITEGMDFLYAGENSFIDHLDPVSGGFTVLRNSSPSYGCAVAWDEGSYRTVGASFELGVLQDGVEPSTRANLVHAVMGFFGLAPNDTLFVDGFESGGASGWGNVVP
jgi:hypothetical protein